MKLRVYSFTAIGIILFASLPVSFFSSIPIVKSDVNSKPHIEKVPILVYHSVRPIYEGMSAEVKQYSVSPESFEQQLQYLYDGGYNTISFDNLVLAAEGKFVLPSKPIVITFDDGWENQYIYAFPILKKFNATATFFIFPNAIGHKNWMTWDQIRELATSEMTIGSHSKSHPYLHKMTDETEITKEIAGSKQIIEAQIGKEVSLFAYPFGEYTKSLAWLIQSSGYKAARTFTSGIYQTGDDLFAIKSIAATDNLDRFKRNFSN